MLEKFGDERRTKDKGKRGEKNREWEYVAMVRLLINTADQMFGKLGYENDKRGKLRLLGASSRDCV